MSNHHYRTLKIPNPRGSNKSPSISTFIAKKFHKERAVFFTAGQFITNKHYQPDQILSSCINIGHNTGPGC